MEANLIETSTRLLLQLFPSTRGSQATLQSLYCTIGDEPVEQGCTSTIGGGRSVHPRINLKKKVENKSNDKLLEIAFKSFKANTYAVDQVFKNYILKFLI